MSLSQAAGAALWMCLPFVAYVAIAAPAFGADWNEVQEIKRNCIRLVAQHAMEQQRTFASAPVPITFPPDVSPAGNLRVTARSADSLSIDVAASPWERDTAAIEHVHIRLAEPLNMLDGHSGLAFTIKTEPGTSPEVRLGCRLIAAGGEKSAVIRPSVPALPGWGENPHEVYFDWAFINYRSIQDAIEVLRSVEAIEMTVGAVLRTPERGASLSPQPAEFTISDLRLVDYLKGSYDSDRGDWEARRGAGLTLQHRTQEVTGVVGLFGGEAGLNSAAESLDMCVRTQCWDGSFLDGRRGARTVVSGEYTHGFTLGGMLDGYLALEESASPLLDQRITIGTATMTRREFYQRMFYRAAMSRASAPPSGYRDDIIGHDTLKTGANRVIGFAISVRLIADALTDPGQRAKVLAVFEPLMEEIADAQGKYSGGFPVLGEGDRYDGRGIHYDAGYVGGTQVKRIGVGVRGTSDPRLVQVLDRYQRVFEAAMNKEGTGIVALVSERGRSSTSSAGLTLPDLTAQLGLKHHLPVLAQWGYNCSKRAWEDRDDGPRNFWTYCSGARGYPLGSFTSVLVSDLDSEPEPRDLGYLFPRQFPVWSSRLYTKDGQLVRTSKVYIHADGTMDNDFEIDVGEYPVTVGVPVLIESPEGTVAAVADALSGWPRLLPAEAPIVISGDLSAEGKVGQTFEFTLNETVHVVITGPDMTLPPEADSRKVAFRADLTLEPEKAGLLVRLTVLRGTVPYEHRFIRK